MLVLKRRQLRFSIEASTIFQDWIVYFWTFSKVIRFSVRVPKSMQLRYTVVFILEQVPFSLLKKSKVFDLSKILCGEIKKTGNFWNLKMQSCLDKKLLCRNHRDRARVVPSLAGHTTRALSLWYLIYGVEFSSILKSFRPVRQQYFAMSAI